MAQASATGPERGIDRPAHLRPADDACSGTCTSPLAQGIVYLTKDPCGENRPGQASTEIEVTPEMIEAGLIAMAWHEPYTGDGAECMQAVYCAMEGMRRERARESSQQTDLRQRSSGTG